MNFPDMRRPILAIYFLAGVMAASLLASAATAYEPPQAVVAAIKEKAGFSGVAIVDTGDGAPFVYVAGGAGRGQPMTPSTRFDIGSITKLMTAVAVMQLSEAGLVNLEAPVGTYLADLPKEARTRTVTEILRHEAGFGDFLEAATRDQLLQARNNHDFYNLALKHPVGSAGAFSYSNTGFVVLGELVERVGGSPYEAYLRTRVLVPAGVRAALFGRSDRIAAPEVAIGLMRPEANGAPPPKAQSEFTQETTALTGWVTSAAGGLYVTAPELASFGRALLGNRLISASGLAKLCPQVSEKTMIRGLGCMVMPDGGLGHNGVRPGMYGIMLASPKTGAVVVALSNHDRQAEGVFWPLWAAVAER
ncbi:serine hydrolase domain-containing protein [Caulobacter sp. NIBR2454]|uniref:serine hydrolase domain-containing protein n=1 Tax=Caulobacter sp. NIBR2454 TaxID=3015996 RepID=UPI0022B67871|nr:serine hydrolase domain-containing protein [Caulobacter sp. NIBR2454]